MMPCFRVSRFYFIRISNYLEMFNFLLVIVKFSFWISCHHLQFIMVACIFLNCLDLKRLVLLQALYSSCKRRVVWLTVLYTLSSILRSLSCLSEQLIPPDGELCYCELVYNASREGKVWFHRHLTCSVVPDMLVSASDLQLGPSWIMCHCLSIIYSLTARRSINLNALHTLQESLNKDG